MRRPRQTLWPHRFIGGRRSVQPRVLGSAPGGRNGWLLMILVLAVLVAACAASVKQLQQFKGHAASNDYAWIAAQEVTCTDNSVQGCNQLHLIKGDAHFRLAKEGRDKEPNYELAADHLERGIALTSEWQVGNLDLNRDQTYENFCEALRNLQDLRTGQAAAAVGERYLQAAEDFHRLRPDHPGAVFFVAQARFRKLQPALVEPGDQRDALAQQLDGLISLVNSALPAAAGGRYEQNLRLLRGTLTMVRDSLASP